MNETTPGSLPVTQGFRRLSLSVDGTEIGRFHQGFPHRIRDVRLVEVSDVPTFGVRRRDVLNSLPVSTFTHQEFCGLY